MSLPHASAGVLLGLLPTLQIEELLSSEELGFLRTSQRYNPQDHDLIISIVYELKIR
jgi:hypothetical protein